MSTATVIKPLFGDRAAIRSASIAGAAYRRALHLGYCRTTAQQFARQAKRDALACETPSAVALRVVTPRTMSAMRPLSGPTRPAA